MGLLRCQLIDCVLDDYSKARRKLGDAELTSNLESEMETTGEQRPTRKRYVCKNGMAAWLGWDTGLET
jgi:hypothetical protein